MPMHESMTQMELFVHIHEIGDLYHQTIYKV